MFEPDVTITDILLVAECAYFSYQCYKHRFKHGIYFWFFVYFGSIASTAFWGALYHGLGYNQLGIQGHWLWKCVLLSSGVSGLSFWMLGKSVYVRHARVSALIKISMILVGLGIVFAKTDSFLLVTIVCLPGLILFFYNLFSRYLVTKNNGFVICLWALILLLVASWMQYAHIAINDIYFTHNATYHVVIMIGGALLFYGGKKVARSLT